jgi:hypothetical protein
MELASYRPCSALVTPVTEIVRPRFPVIDAHNHLAEPFGGGWDKKPLPELLDLLDQVDIRLYIDLDGGWGEDLLNAHLDYFKARSPERFKIFGGVDWSQWPALGNKFPEWAAQRLRLQKARGAEGLKVWKGFGLSVRDQQDVLVAVDDPRLAPLWETAAELGLPVLIHVADPVAFFWPVDGQNERWEELGAHPDWRFPSPPFPPFLSIVTGLANLVAAHPRTTFIGAHVGCYAENLAWVAELLERCLNFYVDIGARIAELGRQPYSARKFFLRFSDRILFGTDMGPDLEVYRIYFRFLETADEYFNYDPQDPPPQGRWQVYGLSLPDEVLEKVYYRNAERVIGKPG